MSREQHHAALHIIQKGKGTSSDTIDSHDKYASALVESKIGECSKSGCHKKKTLGSRYCRTHTCETYGCYSYKNGWEKYCDKHLN